MKKAREKKIQWLILSALLSFLIIWPLFRQGFWQSDDGEWMVIRFSAFHESLRDGHFPVRWTQRLNHSYGYPVFNFLYPLPFYLAEIPRLLGFGFVDSIKVIVGASVMAGAIGMYLFAKKWGHFAAFIASLVYIVAPYRTFLLYERGSLGESVALAAVPFIFWFSDRLLRLKNWISVILLGISYAALIMSHNIIAALFTPLLLLYMFTIILKSKEKLYALRSTLYAILLGLSLSAFFWMPALWDLQYTREPQTQVSEYAAYFLSGMKLLGMLGIVPVGFILLGLLKRNLFFPILGLLAVFFMHPISSAVVGVFPWIEKIQFPWRLSTVFLFTSAVTAAQVFATPGITRKLRWVAFVFVSIALLTSVLPSTTNIRYINRPEGFYTTNDDTTTVKKEFTPIWVRQDPTNKADRPFEIFATQGSYEVLDQELKTGNYYLQLRLREPARLRFYTHYFPGWKLYVDDEAVAPDPDKTEGLLEVNLSPGTNDQRIVKALFERTPVRSMAEWISLVSMLIVLVLAVINRFPGSNWTKRIGIVVGVFAMANIGFFILTNLPTYRQKFDPVQMESAYLNSQWVNPDARTSKAIGDSGLYTWAGWAYLHGKNPVLINPEMPPLGKYIIGLMLIVTMRPAMVGFILASFALTTHFVLARYILKDIWLALTATALLSLEPVMHNLLNITMLDGLQVSFLNLTLLFFLKGLKQARWFALASLMLGGVAATKFYVSAAVVIIALTGFLILFNKWQKLVFFLLSLPIAGIVHIASYAIFFIQGNTIRSYFGAQKWIYEFYRQGNVGTVPLGSYWLLVLFNRWRIWFGQQWGMFTTIKSNLWRISWPINLLAALVAVVSWMKKRLPEEFGVLVVWLAVYSVFLTFIIGWPHYMLLFLPYSYILLVQLGKLYGPKLIKLVS
ncbi:MAG: hypothetical protein A2900_03115 [Candidatus Chisholmbacteria bacterium RIFCSPLOWO2_01_FULL_50_28]|uniref:Glycosyltransferase RgtA/B/C/D-like domain-containing protein n=1 Tax=Candidatus Chisholmbacteria bacterium RIFCSPHIGHO2_01_FULL_52_32 TaxID=1797591 RepID=A0A1G1VT30_9BACT|nr:MAG: hypothetical protein A2786_03630 [Candidatus Chisholmbacteria bacterium RIFCSPHIGHO2_01_FULL_52_32]OGY20066.1 MAG: hypothetical protein A2900_03115 [Candidatus Chisholmbacteria bacterium RIFCSPLOWO2_01_FULL_50_28]